MINNLPSVRGTYKYGEPLKNHTWLNVGGPADVMFIPADEDDLRTFLKKRPADCKIFVLGGGSNLLVRDGGIEGAVIKLSAPEFCRVEVKDDAVVCGAGILNSVFGKTVAAKGLDGLEFLCSIPGTPGGALRSNAGCFGREMSDVLVSARAVDSGGDIVTMKNEDFNFAYRHSDFPADYIITSVCLKYEKKDPAEVRNLIAEQAEYRKSHQPQGIRTAGSTFKNPPEGSAWKFIKESGADKLEFGGVRMSPVHCNFLQNDGTADAASVEKLCQAVSETVKKKCGVVLEPEIKITGRAK